MAASEHGNASSIGATSQITVVPALTDARGSVSGSTISTGWTEIAGVGSLVGSGVGVGVVVEPTADVGEIEGDGEVVLAVVGGDDDGERLQPRTIPDRMLTQTALRRFMTFEPPQVAAMSRGYGCDG
jgi:hypothetical protein